MVLSTIPKASLILLMTSIPIIESTPKSENGLSDSIGRSSRSSASATQASMVFSTYCLMSVGFRMLVAGTDSSAFSGASALATSLSGSAGSIDRVPGSFMRTTPSLSVTRICCDAPLPSLSGFRFSVCRNPSTAIKCRHIRGATNGLPGILTSSSSNNHHPSRSPKVRVVKSTRAVASFKIRHPWVFSSGLMVRRVC